MKNLTRATWMEIDLDNLIYNYNEIKKTIGEDTDVIPIVKADAYGHGAVRIVKSLISEGAKLFGVAHLSEALHIKKYVPDQEVVKAKERLDKKIQFAKSLKNKYNPQVLSNLQKEQEENSRSLSAKLRIIEKV